MSIETPQSVVLLLGAGFSASAELPTSVQLAERFKAFIIDRANTKGPKPLKLLHFYIEGGIRFQFGKLGKDPSGAVNVEQIAIAARHLLARESNPIAPFVAGWHPHLIQLLADEPRLLEDYLSCFYDHLYSELGSPLRDKIAYIDRLAQIAVTYCGLDIFSLNYDCCVEKALQPFCDRHKDMQLVDGFSDKGWQPDLFNKTLDGRCVIRLFKMHGSLNWVNSQEFGLVNLDKIDPERAVELTGIPPHLVFGTDVKLTGEQPFFSMAHLLYEKLSKADIFVVIGYGFCDGYVNSIISQAQRANTDLRLMHVSPNAHKGLGEGEGAREIRVDKIVSEPAGPLIANYGLEEEIARLVKDSSKAPPF